ncbi:hypothetical protein ACNUDN_05919 [Mycobacterium sp. smrl_JER01]|uniref:hypothetical protein n=1 Tax=Mycobacterium sp. smrl_JER01 TaxID=3402633 RepID=UPI003D71D877
MFDRRLKSLEDRLQAAIERGELPAIDSSFVGILLASPVQLFVSRGARGFSRAGAHRVTTSVLAGVQATATEMGDPAIRKSDVENDQHWSSSRSHGDKS